MKNYAEFGLAVPEVLLPAKKDISTWSVIACDQYTQDESYWKNVEKAVGDAPSTLSLILPEVYLNAKDKSQRIKKIHQSMEAYLKDGVFDDPLSAFIYIERKTEYGRLRHGLLAALDLDCYDWTPFTKALVRATEATIIDRIPPRKEIRCNAPLESPHIMLLVNDPTRSLVEAAGERAKKSSPCVYDGDLMLGAGHISGWAITSDDQQEQIADALDSLKKAGAQNDGSSFLFAVGDGNHSLATAKTVWEEHKAALRAQGESEEKIMASPLRYAMVEIVNIYDTGLTFEPIHRVLLGASGEDTAAFCAKKLGGTLEILPSEAELKKAVSSSTNSFGFVYMKDGKEYYQCLRCDFTELAVSRIQVVLDEYCNNAAEKISMDYIHGEAEVFRLGKMEGRVSIMLPPIVKDSFFATISSLGPLPRKSFSMGESSEKRFYLECRRLYAF